MTKFKELLDTKINEKYLYILYIYYQWILYNWVKVDVVINVYNVV